MIALLGTVLSQARTLLNDDDGVTWPDNRLIPKAQHGFNMLQAALLLAGIPIINSVSTIIAVPATTADDGNIDLSTISGYPTDMIMPISIKERMSGQRNVDFVDMSEVEFIPNTDIASQMCCWCWQKQTILLRGCLNNVQLQLRYQSLLPMPSLNTDSTCVILSEMYLSWKVAALASMSTRDFSTAKEFDSVAERNLDSIVRMNIKQQQDLPAKRIPYHRRGGGQVLKGI